MQFRSLWSICQVSLIFVLSGCGQTTAPWATPENKINAAFPVSEKVRVTRDFLLQNTGDKQRKFLETQLDNRMKLRALNCAKGYSPTWLTSTSDIRKSLSALPCFSAADEQLVQWLGLMRVGVTLAMPALRPIPANPPTFIVGDTFITSARFAKSAGVGLIESQKTISIVEMESSKVLFVEPKSNTIGIGELSPNGRIFLTSSQQPRVLYFRDSENGDVIAELPMAGIEFTWLDNATAAYPEQTVKQPYLVDFNTGEMIEVKGIAGGSFRAVAVADTANQYAFFSHTKVAKIEYLRDQAEPTVKLIAEQSLPNGGTCSISTVVGKRVVCWIPDLSSVDPKTFEVDSVAFKPFTIQKIVPTPDADQVVITGYFMGHSNETPKSYIYSLSNKALSLIDRSREPYERLTYVQSVNKLATIKDAKIEFLGKLPLAAPVALQTFFEDEQTAINLAKLKSFELAQSGSGGTPSFPPNSLPAPTGPFARLSKVAQVEAVGVYQGGGSKQALQNHGTGTVEVRIRRTPQPLVLVLSSYEPVKWVLTQESGAVLAAVIVSGYYPSQVIGAGNVPVIVNGRAHAYERGGQGYYELNKSVATMVGKEIGLFQGSYQGANFVVGSNARW